MLIKLRFQLCTIIMTVDTPNFKLPVRPPPPPSILQWFVDLTDNSTCITSSLGARRKFRMGGGGGKPKNAPHIEKKEQKGTPHG